MQCTRAADRVFLKSQVLGRRSFRSGVPQLCGFRVCLAIPVSSSHEHPQIARIVFCSRPPGRTGWFGYSRRPVSGVLGRRPLASTRGHAWIPHAANTWSCCLHSGPHVMGTGVCRPDPAVAFNTGACGLPHVHVGTYSWCILLDKPFSSRT